ncbi:MAG: DUF58 domain-containing protein [Candidatus Bathyarchaeota archaeon]|nr:DUF58 domain-containing protein [Candidatus Bathyarchaeota archaeon]
MPKLTLKTIIKAYLIVILLLGILISPLPQFALALTLLALQLYTTYRPPNPKMNLAIIFGTLTLTPLTLTPLAGTTFSVLFITPTIYLLDQNLQENAQDQTSTHSKNARTPTITLKILSTALSIVFLATLITLNITLLLSTTILIVYLTAILGHNLIKIPKNPLKETKTWNRTLAGNPSNNTIEITTTSKLHLHTTLTATESWIQITPTKYTTTNTSQTVKITYTPPLAGPTKLQLHATTIGPRGLIPTNQTLQPVDLHIIPKAKYAQWLAKKYLEQTATGTASALTTSPPRTTTAAKYGLEYYGSRLYQPGDRLKEVDWKHTFTLGELVVKEYSGAHGQPTIIAADLTAKDTQDADKLAYNLIIVALTSARESLPSALAVYNQKESIASTALNNPRETLKETLKITEKITIVDQAAKALQPTEIRRLKKFKEEVEKTQKILAKILDFEVEAKQAITKQHPATQTLNRCIDKTPPPAIITVASSMTQDMEVLSLTLEKLKTQGYTIVLMPN